MKKIRLSTVSQVYEAFLHSRKALGAKEVTLRTYRTSFLAVCKHADISELPMEELSHLDCYDLHPGVTDDEMLGRIYVEAMEMLDVPDNVLPYFDFEAYGRDMRINESGHFAPHGLSDPQRRLQGGLSRDRGHSCRIPHFCVPQIEYPGADGGLQGDHRPFILGGRAPAPEKGAFTITASVPLMCRIAGRSRRPTLSWKREKA